MDRAFVKIIEDCRKRGEEIPHYAYLAAETCKPTEEEMKMAKEGWGR